MHVFDILQTYRTSLRTTQFDFLQARLQARQMLHWQNIVVAKALHFLANTSVQLTQIEALYQGIQSLMAGDILAISYSPTRLWQWPWTTYNITWTQHSLT